MPVSRAPLSVPILAVNGPGTVGTAEKFRVNTPSTVDNNAAAIISTSGTGDRGLVIQGVSGQTGLLFVLQASTGVAALTVGVTGNITLVSGAGLFADYLIDRVSTGAYIQTTASTTGVLVQTRADANRGLNVRGFSATQSGNLMEWQDFHGVAQSSVNSTGGLTTNGTTSIISNLAVPAFSTAANGTSFYYVITATNVAGETIASASIGRTTNTPVLAWPQVVGATGYKIYRNSSNAFVAGSLLLTTITNGTTLTYTDSGSATTAGLPPTVPTGTKLQIKGWSGQTAASQEWLDAAGTVNGSMLPSGVLTLGTSAATTGTIRLANAAAIFWRKADNSADNCFIDVNSSNQLRVNGDFNVLLQVGATTYVNINSVGVSISQGGLVMADGIHFNSGTGTGTKLGTTTSQKLSLWNKTPIIQPTTSVVAGAFVANTSGIVNDTATFAGYTIGQIAAALKNFGLLA